MRKTFFLMLVLVLWLWPSVAGCASGESNRNMRRPDAGASTRWLTGDAGPLPSPVFGMDAGIVGSRDAGTALVSTDAGSPPVGVPELDAGRDAGRMIAPVVREACNGADDDHDGSVDEDFLCPLGRVGEVCVTSCGAAGQRRCVAPSCSWSDTCEPFEESCNTIDDDCDGAVDEGCDDPSAEDPRLMRITLDPAMSPLCPAGWRIRLWLSSPAEESPRGGSLTRPIPSLVGPWSSISLWCDEATPPWFVWDASDHDALGSGVFSELSMDGFDLRPSTRICEDPLSPGTGFRPILMWDAARRGSCPP